MKRRKAFTLIEVLIALVILSIAIVAILGSSIRIETRARNKATLAQYHRLLLELLGQAQDGTLAVEGTPEKNPACAWQVLEENLPLENNNQFILKTVRLTIPENEGKTEILLSYVQSKK